MEVGGGHEFLQLSERVDQLVRTECSYNNRSLCPHRIYIFVLGEIANIPKKMARISISK